MDVLQSKSDSPKGNSKLHVAVPSLSPRTWPPSSHERRRNGAVRNAIIIATGVAAVLCCFNFMLDPLRKGFIPRRLSKGASSSTGRLAESGEGYVSFEDVRPPNISSDSKKPLNLNLTDENTLDCTRKVLRMA
jgi:hypothetical protein